MLIICNYLDERSSPVSNVGLEKSNIDDEEEEYIQEKDDLEVVQAKLIPLTDVKDDDTEELVKENLELIDNEEKHEANDANEGQATETYVSAPTETSTPVEDFEKITENGELKILINENEESENTETQELEVEGVNQVEDLEFNNTETDTEKQDIPETDIDLNSEKIKDFENQKADEETNNDDDENKDTGLESVEDQEKAQTERTDNIEDGPINEVKTDPTQTTDQPDTFVKELDKIDIDLEDTEVQQAATKIQAGFRGHKARKELKKNVNVDETTEQEQNTIELLNDDSNMDIDLMDPDVEQAATKIQAGFRGIKARQEVKKLKEQREIVEDVESFQNEDLLMEKEAEVDIDLTDSDVEKAATKIQAGFRGIKARQDVQKMKEKSNYLLLDEQENTGETESLLEPELEPEVDIILTDNEEIKYVHAAEPVDTDVDQIYANESVQSLETDLAPKTEPNSEIDIDFTDPDVEQAATKIQAGFRGIKARQEVKKMQDERKAVHHVDIERATTEETDALIQSEPESNPEADIDLTDPDVEQASTMINNIGETEYILKNEPEPETEIDIDLTDPDVEQAATKIQAGFRGIKARQEVKKMKDESKLVFPPEEVNIVEFESILENKPAHDTEIDIDLTDPDMELAATKIQAGFRGIKARQEVKKIRDESKLVIPPDEENTVESESILINEPAPDPEIDIDLTDPEVEQAATKIQAGFRGIKARQEVKKMKDEKVIVDQTEDIDESKLTANPLTEPEIDIDLTDPEVEQAATKIQAGFRGIKARQEVKKMKDDKAINEQTEEVDESKLIENPDLDIDLTDPKTEHAATKIQAGFRGSKARQEVQKMKEEIKSALPAEQVDKVETEPLLIPEPEVDIDLTDPDVEQAATKIQAGFRGIKARQEVKKMKDEKEIIQITEQEQISEQEPIPEQELSDIDINLTDPEVEQAATKIQAGFRGIKARQEVKKMKNTNESAQPEETEMENETEEKVDIDLTDPDMELAATKIQAGFRGIKARQEVKKMKDECKSIIPLEEENMVAIESILENEPAPDPETDIDLADPDVEQAATKIQAGFRGIKARQEVKKMKDEKESLQIIEQALIAEQEPLTNQDFITSQEPITELEPTDTEKEDKDLIDLTDPDMERAATKIQAGFRGIKARQEVKKMKDEKEFVMITEQELITDQEPAAPEIEDKNDVDIDFSDPDLEQAATKIQAGFRGLKARQEVKKMKGEEEFVQITEQEQADLKNELESEPNIDIDLTDPDVEQAATKIQAGFRGIKARKEVKKIKEESSTFLPSKQGDECKVDPLNELKHDPEINIDLTDPDVEQAATKIQAGFRGIKARQEVKKMKDESNPIISPYQEQIIKTESLLNVNPEPTPEVDSDLDCEAVVDNDNQELEDAATKIQAGFKGMKARKEVKKRKEDAKAKDDEGNMSNATEDVSAVGEEETEEGTVLGEPLGEKNDSYPSQDDGYISPLLSESTDIHTGTKKQTSLN